MMVLGPVFHFELVRIARRWQFYTIRFAFGAVLLFLIAVNYLSFFDPQNPWQVLSPPPVTLRQLAQFGQGLFYSLMAAQAGLVFLLTPGLVADAISGERQRKTLHYLMTSRIFAPEIVLGKLAARMLHIAVFLAVTLPVLSLLTLVGGIDPELLLWGFIGTATTAFLMAAIAILASATIRRPRESFLASYLFSIFFFAGPALLEALGNPSSGWWTPLVDALHWVNEWFRVASPLGLLSVSTLIRLFGNGGPASLLDQIAIMSAFQLAYGAVLVVLAAVVLRPAYRWIESRGGEGSRRKGRRRLRILPRPAVSDAPIYWKEAHVTGRGAGPIRWLSRFAVVGLILWITGTVLWEAPDAFRELWRGGFFAPDWQGYQARYEFNFAIRVGGGALLALGMLALGSITSSSIASEREQDTWISLLATSLDGDDILRGKMLGSLRLVVPLYAPLFVLLLVGVAAGAIHPVGLLLGTLGIVLSTWYVLAMGTYFSLISSTAWRAQAATLGLLILPHFCCMFPSPIYLTALALLAYPEMNVGQWSMPTIRSWQEILPLVMITAYFVGGPVLHFFAAYFFTKGAFAQFDLLANRPRDPRPWLRSSAVFLDPAKEKPDPLVE